MTIVTECNRFTYSSNTKRHWLDHSCIVHHQHHNALHHYVCSPIWKYFILLFHVTFTLFTLFHVMLHCINVCAFKFLYDNSPYCLLYNIFCYLFIYQFSRVEYKNSFADSVTVTCEQQLKMLLLFEFPSICNDIDVIIYWFKIG